MHGLLGKKLDFIPRIKEALFPPPFSAILTPLHSLVGREWCSPSLSLCGDSQQDSTPQSHIIFDRKEEQWFHFGARWGWLTGCTHHVCSTWWEEGGGPSFTVFSWTSGSLGKGLGPAGLPSPSPHWSRLSWGCFFLYSLVFLQATFNAQLGMYERLSFQPVHVFYSSFQSPLMAASWISSKQLARGIECYELLPFCLTAFISVSPCLWETGFLRAAVWKSKYFMKPNTEQEMKLAATNLIQSFEKLSSAQQAHIPHE